MILHLPLEIQDSSISSGIPLDKQIARVSLYPEQIDAEGGFSLEETGNQYS